MDPISASPTRNDVVRETTMRSLNVAKETKQGYAIVTYDLAYSIQSLDAQPADPPWELPLRNGFVRCFWHVYTRVWY